MSTHIFLFSHMNVFELMHTVMLKLAGNAEMKQMNPESTARIGPERSVWLTTYRMDMRWAVTEDSNAHCDLNRGKQKQGVRV